MFAVFVELGCIRVNPALFSSPKQLPPIMFPIYRLMKPSLILLATISSIMVNSPHMMFVYTRVDNISVVFGIVRCEPLELV